MNLPSPTTRILLILLTLTLSSFTFAGNPTPFGPPVQVTTDPGKGYEPYMVIDKFGNMFATAHKENWQLVLGPDPNSPTYTRSMSWDWVSVDGGKTWKDIPGLTALSLEQHEFGDEGDMALDDANHLYFVDTNVADDSITRWSVTGPGQISIDFTRPLIPAAQLVDDRPWVIAHGDGHVFYFGNEGDKVTYPLGSGTGSGFGPGRYTVYASTDGGMNFNSTGYTLRDSGWCRPATDHTPGTHYVYAFCNDDAGNDGVLGSSGPNGKLYSYVSSDDGKSFERYDAGTYKGLDPYYSWPTVEVAPDGSLWALYVDAKILSCTTDPTTGFLFGDCSYDTTANSLVLFHSTDHGKTWQRKDITPAPGRYEYGWLAVSPDGKKLGIGVYYKANDATPWKVYGGIFQPWQKPTLTSLADNDPVASATATEAPGDLMGSYFNPDGTLSVIWTRPDAKVEGVARISRSIFTARSQP